MENNYFGMDGFNRDTMYLNAAEANDAILEYNNGSTLIKIDNNINKISAANIVLEDGMFVAKSPKACSKEASIRCLRRSDFLTLRR